VFLVSRPKVCPCVEAPNPGRKWSSTPSQSATNHHRAQAYRLSKACANLEGHCLGGKRFQTLSGPSSASTLIRTGPSADLAEAVKGNRTNDGAFSSELTLAATGASRGPNLHIRHPIQVHVPLGIGDVVRKGLDSNHAFWLGSQQSTRRSQVRPDVVHCAVRGHKRGEQALILMLVGPKPAAMRRKTDNPLRARQLAPQHRQDCRPSAQHGAVGAIIYLKAM
jgi:hypothetical protein